MKVLIVEDDYKLMKTYQSILESTFDVYSAMTVKEAQEIINKQDLDVALLDIMLPDGEGYSLIEPLKKHSQTIIIMVSALDEEKSRRKAYECGADDFMIKPVTLFELEYKLKAIKKRQANDKMIYKIGDITLNLENLTMSTDFNQIQIQYSQGVVLKWLYEKQLANDILYKTELTNMEEISKTDNFRIHTLISRLRKNLEELESERLIIENVYGKGYRLVVMR